MTLALQLTVAGLATGCIYALIALGIVLIYKASGVVNFAQGAYAMLGAYLSYLLLKAGLPAVPAVLGGMLLMAAVGAATERLVLRRMLQAPVVAVMIVTLGLLIFIKALGLALWGPEPRAYPPIFPAGSVDLAGIFMTYNYLAAGGLALLLGVGFLLFYRHTAIGLMQRCAADNSRAALAIGIHVSRQVSIAWALSAALAALGGSLLASLNSLSPELANIGLVAFPVVVLGGLTSLPGALLAGLAMGVLETWTEGLLTPALEGLLRRTTGLSSVGALQLVVPYALLVLMLAVRPQGLLGRRGTERV